ncbi:MAG: polyphosphate kinase 2 family protein [Pseudolabrys sp.]
MKLEHLAKRFRIDKPYEFKLADHKPADTCDLDIDKKEAKDMLEEGVERLSDLQERLYASDRWSLLLVFQAMDAAGKDGAIKHVMTGVNPQGCQVHSFKQPSAEELDHDFLWRVAKALPERGRIGIFNRSHYEEVLVVRVHPEFMEKQKLPPVLNHKDIWQHRFEDIRHFEDHLVRNGTRILKFFLNVSREEQRQRFLDRIDEPAKNWKFSMSDVKEREHWDAYMAAYEDMIRNTSTHEAPWYVVPADNKWFTRVVVAAAVANALDELNLQFPKVGDDMLQELQQAKKALEGEKG